MGQYGPVRMRWTWPKVTVRMRGSLRTIGSLSTRNGAWNESEYAQNARPMIAATRSACLVAGGFPTGDEAAWPPRSRFFARLLRVLPAVRIVKLHPYMLLESDFLKGRRKAWWDWCARAARVLLAIQRQTS